MQAALTRRPGDRLIGGVAGGIADHVGWPVLTVRLAFFTTTFAGGFGAIAYAVFWIVLPEGAGAGPVRRRAVVEVLALTAFATVGVITLATSSTRQLLAVPVLAAIGAALIWRQAGDAQRRRLLALPRSTRGPLADRARLIGGAACIAGGIAVVLSRSSISSVGSALVSTLITLAGVALLAGPWLLRLLGELNVERRERIRSQERAELAAQVHDSVLQTLTLIRRNAGDEQEVARLSRLQERELRDLLYGRPSTGQALAAQLRLDADEVERMCGVEVEVVVVGDAPLDDRLRALCAAARECLLNAGKHAGVTAVSLYAEVGDTEAVVFVRDRGVGFDEATVAADRRGLRGSVRDRVERHGGTCVVRSSAGQGTEVELRVPR